MQSDKGKVHTGQIMSNLFKYRYMQSIVFVAAVLAAILMVRNVCAATGASREILVASGGHAHVSIVVGEKSNEFCQYAASELARYLKLMSGADVAIIKESE